MVTSIHFKPIKRFKCILFLEFNIKYNYISKNTLYKIANLALMKQWLALFLLKKRRVCVEIVKYIGVLIKSIYVSSFGMLRHVIRTGGAFETETVTCILETKRPLYQVLICIGITLTPGTIVSRKDGDEIDVLKLCDGDTMPHKLFDQIFSEGV